MVAPRQPQHDSPASSDLPQLREARRWVAATMLAPAETAGRRALPVARWKAWLVAAWMAAVAVGYLAWLLGG